MAESIQKKLLRVRPPRVRITYDVETGGAIEKRELPFIVGILADLSGDRPDAPEMTPVKQRRMIDIDRDVFNDVMKTVKPRVALTGLKKTSPTLAAMLNKPGDEALVFQSLDDFEPLSIVRSLPSLNAFYRARGQIRSLQARLEADDDMASLLDDWVSGANGDGPDRALLGELVKALAPPADPKNGTGHGAPAQAHDPAANSDPAPDKGAGKAAKAGANPAAPKQDPAQPQPAAAGTDRAAQLAALIDLVDMLHAAEPGADGKVPDPSDAELAALKKYGSLQVAADAKPDSAAVARARNRAKMLIAALSESNTLANRVLAKKLLAKASADDPVTLTAWEEALQKATLAVLGDQLAALQGIVDKLDINTPMDPGWAKAMLSLGCAFDEPDEVVARDPLDARTVQAAVLAADERGRVMDFAAFLSTSPSANPGAAEAIYDVLERAPQETAGAGLLRLHYFVSEVLAKLDTTNGSADTELENSAKRGGAAAAIDQRVVQIDQALSLALSDIMHAPVFQQIEATWRGLAYLVFNTETSTMLKLRVFNATQAELLKDMQKAVEFDQSRLFKLIYEAEYGSYGGTPYSLLVGDYRLGGGQDDIDFLKKMAEVAAAAHAPFLAAAHESLFGLSGFGDLDKPRDLKKIFEAQELAGWREFRELDDARYVSLVLPRVLLRLPYGQPDKRNTMPCEGLNFEEQVSDTRTFGVADSYPVPKNDRFLWGNPAYVLAERITNAFSLFSWTAAIRGVEGGGLVEGLPLYTFTSDSGMTELFCPTEVAITDRREKELNDLGFISLCHCKGSGKAAFFGGQTTNQPKKYFADDANANARISAMLPYILAASRFAHYIKVIIRDKIGSFLTRANVEAYLNTWIANYVLLDDNATQEVKSSYPLRSASVVVTEVPGEPGAYRATVFLKPHFQLEELTTSIRLVANLPK
jgi:type VI secretion system ImpC/EvpB family protein/type VI secretion system ImpB/VipA family protein